VGSVYDLGFRAVSRLTRIIARKTIIRSALILEVTIIIESTTTRQF
jgi:hypothetical protein